ncbi:MAG: TolC family outer membrane protein [Hoeflea sp.]|uniref:TolC family outer membrane protein n=1 Tax=Hoeflea sp. TaxID=1940281 RepID=UPI001D95C152|nr:TolC family outer membrane protein [Hoeflea sp.]MBU4530727.1 TolC family outer membrane protein [Alphaproteobacteria bacterium]MBU4544947.1 TolC family outer membrane protein [Alphaproteobacteria bacterium]MBU4552090.1 TolC family outer membrane protein [Alphaproteobacteria bacterium]MBV1722279.1 TolC family outer membrane protein [Hoeflea sp.]MBV1761841.1 TolC family outer membrane protein [Hoeflea sp.]
MAVALLPQAASAETLYQAMAKAYENNPDLNAARAGLRATDEGVALAKSGYRPTIAAEAVTTSTSTNGFVNNSASLGVSINQTLFDGFQTRNNVRAAEAQVFAGRENLRGTEIDILLATVQAYANVNRDNQIVSFRQQNISFLQEQFSAARARFDVGESTRTDVSLAEAQLAGARASLTAAIAQAKSSAAVYAQIVGTAPNRLQAVSLPRRLLPGSLEAAVAQGTTEHPAVLAALFGVDAAGYAVKSEEGAFLPGVRVSGSVSKADEGVDTAQIQARLTIPIYQGGAASASVRQAKERLGQQRILVDSARRSIEQSVVSSWTQMEASLATIEANRAQLSAANLALNGVVEERRVGQRTTLDVLNAQQTVLTAKEAISQSERNAVVASFSVLASTGKLTIDRLGLAVANYRPEEHYEATKDRWYGLRTVDGR